MSVDEGSGQPPAGRRGRPLVAVIVLDGWGHADPGPGNAISLAWTPVWDSLLERYPHTLIEASGEAVGLPVGVTGNSEVGHLTLGAGRVLYQDLSRINRAVASGSFFENPVLVPAMEQASAAGTSVHLMGLLSEGGVHSAIEHLHALVELAKRKGVRRLYVHAFTDGRDTDPLAGRSYIEDLTGFLREKGLGEIATISGRYYAMDRDKRWQRTRLTYDALVKGEGFRASDALTAITRSYNEGVTDEFVLPTIVSDDLASRIRDGDLVIFFNFRPDRARQLTRALIEEDFEGFERGSAPPRVRLVSMTQYDRTFDVPVAFPEIEPRHVLAQVLSEAGLRQLHIAETEKYAHVTFFFNGGREEPYPGEIHRLIPSPTDVETYDKKPAMSAYEVARRFRETLAAEEVDFVILNFANPDMVGHTGDLAATIKAVEHVDSCLGEVLQVLRARDALVFVTSDHGNAEYLLNPDGSTNTAHTTNPVPLVCLREDMVLRAGAGLADIAPTVLQLLDLPVPEEMTGRSLCWP